MSNGRVTGVEGRVGQENFGCKRMREGKKYCLGVGLRVAPLSLSLARLLAMVSPATGG